MVNAQYTYSTCGGTNVMTLNSLQIVPHPIVRPANAQFLIEVYFSDVLVNPIQVCNDIHLLVIQSRIVLLFNFFVGKRDSSRKTRRIPQCASSLRKWRWHVLLQ